MRYLKIIGISFIFIILFFSITEYIYRNEKESPLYKIEQYLTYSKEDWINYARNNQISNTIQNNDISTMDNISESIDTLYPVDINNLEPILREKEEEIIKNAHFENLKISTDSPSNEDAQYALVHFTENRLIDVIVNQKLNIKVGNCYDNPTKDENFKVVSCMVLLFNREKKNRQEAPDGFNFMKNAYDFYKLSEGDFWEAKDLTMKIPFDYDLFKHY